MIILHLTVGWLTEENFSIDPSLTVTNLLAALLWHKGLKSTLQLLKGTLNEQEQTTLHLLVVSVTQCRLSSCSIALRPTYFQTGMCMEEIYNGSLWPAGADPKLLKSIVRHVYRKQNSSVFLDWWFQKKVLTFPAKTVDSEIERNSNLRCFIEIYFLEIYFSEIILWLKGRFSYNILHMHVVWDSWDDIAYALLSIKTFLICRFTLMYQTLLISTKCFKREILFELDFIYLVNEGTQIYLWKQRKILRQSHWSPIGTCKIFCF